MHNQSRNCLTVAFATIQDLPDIARLGLDAERSASRIAADRAIRGIIGPSGTIDVRRRAGRAPIARILDNADGHRRVALSVSHRDGRAAAVAAPAGSMVGIDLENLEAIDLARERFFLTERERHALPSVSACELWAMKEAVWKALELSSSVAFHELELDIEAGGVVRGARCRGTSLRAVMHLTSPWPGYVLALAKLGGVS